MEFKVKDEHTQNTLFHLNVLEGENEFPLWFLVSEGEVGLSSKEGKDLYHFLQEMYDPKIENE